MQDLNDKINNGGATADGQLSADEWNQLPSEIQNVIEGLGIALSGADLNQLGKGIAGYVANGNFLIDSGAADAYVLSTVGSKQGASAYAEGQKFTFTPSNANTGASTVNAFGIGLIDIKLAGGIEDPIAGEIATTKDATIVYRTAPGVHFELQIDDPSLLAEFEVTGSAVTAVDFTGLDINTHKSYRVELELINATGSGAQIGFEVNGDTTTTNYHYQGVFFSSTGLSGNRTNGNRCAFMDASADSYSNIAVGIVGSQATYQSSTTRNIGSSIQAGQQWGAKTNATVANITQLTFRSAIALAIDVGSKIRIYRGDV